MFIKKGLIKNWWTKLIESSEIASWIQKSPSRVCPYYLL